MKFRKTIPINKCKEKHVYIVCSPGHSFFIMRRRVNPKLKLFSYKRKYLNSELVFQRYCESNCFLSNARAAIGNLKKIIPNLRLLSINEKRNFLPTAFFDHKVFVKK